MKKKQDGRGVGWEPKVFWREDKNRWCVDCGRKFSPRRTFYTTEAEANAYAKTRHDYWVSILNDHDRTKKNEIKTRAVVRTSEWSNSDRARIVASLEQVGGDVGLIEKAVEFYLKHHSGPSKAVWRVYGEYIRIKKRNGRRDASIKDIKVKLRKFVRAFGRMKINQITVDDIDKFFKAQKFSLGTEISYRSKISAFLTFGIKRGYRGGDNPISKLEDITVDQSLPSVLAVDEVRRLLGAAESFLPKRYIVARRKGHKVKGGGLVPFTDDVRIYEARSSIVPYLAIGLFAGLRPKGELPNLDWRDVDFIKKTIRVSPEFAKKRRQRYVEMSQNLIRWIKPYAKTEGKIGFSRRILRTVQTTAGVKWSSDVMRHSYGSYHIAFHHDAARTSLEMGHSRIGELFKSYRNLVTPGDAKLYWKIVPTCNNSKL